MVTYLTTTNYAIRKHTKQELILFSTTYYDIYYDQVNNDELSIDKQISFDYFCLFKHFVRDIKKHWSLINLNG